MKKIVLISVVGVVVLLAAIYGRDLLGLYRLQAFVTEQAAADEKSKGPWPNLVYECEGCHGDKGHSKFQAYPNLAGLPAEYLATQLRNFASGQRYNPTMSPLAMTLSAHDIETMSAYFASQTAVDNTSFKANPELRKKGEEIISRGGCTACHGAGLVGAKDFPRLAGQGYDYLVDQLNAFAANTRPSPGNVMNQLASAWSADERKAIATFLASHPVGGNAQSQGAR